MTLKNKNAVIDRAGSAGRGAGARAFPREGANVFLTGRHLTSVDKVAKDILAAGAVAVAAEVEARV